MRNNGGEPLAAQIQRDVVDSNVPVSDILRKAKILASLLRNVEFKRWVDSELGGYDARNDLPEYRKFRPANLGTFSGYFGSMVRNYPIAVSLLPDELRKFAELLTVVQSVKEIETLNAQATDKGVSVPWPPEAVILARDHVTVGDGYELVEAWKPLTKGQMEGILDQVRNRLLEFLIELEQTNPEVMKSEEAIRAVPAEKVQNIFHTTVLGGQNVVAAGTNFTQKVSQTVKVGDIQSLCDHLRGLGLPEDALAELRSALTQDGERPQRTLGDAVKSWLAKMTVRAIDGTWKVALNAAPGLLNSALSNFYGWS